MQSAAARSFIKPTKLTNGFTLGTHRIDSQPFTPPGILKCFVENTWWEHIATKDFVVQLVRAHFASRHPKNNNVSSKTLKSDSSRQTGQESGPITSYPLPFWENSHFPWKIEMMEQENSKSLHLRSHVLRCKFVVLHQRDPMFYDTR